MIDVRYAPATELTRAVRLREISPVELVQRCIDRIGELNEKINAFVALRADEALAEAVDLEQRLEAGEKVGLLAGLPVGVKDLEDVAGMPTTFGSVPFREHRPASDSVQVARLKAAGAIILGKTNTPEFGYTGFTKNLLFGVTRNPWNLERTPGGSSGGSAAAIAAGMVPLVTASDGGGSVRIPACYVGAFGMKPSYGRVPVGARMPGNMLPWIDTVCYGPITRTVRDAAFFLDCVAGPDPSDPDSLPPPGVSYASVLAELPPGLSIGVSKTLGYAQVEPDVWREVEQAIGTFRGLGHTVEMIDDRLPDLGPEWAFISGAETYALLADAIEEHRERWGRSFLEGLERSAATATPAFVGRAQRKRAELHAALAKIFARHTLLLTPTLPTEAFAAKGPFPTTIGGEPIATPLGAVAFTYPFNLSGHPAATVRAGLTDAGLPAGLQIVGPRHRDDLVLQAAYAYEQARPWNDQWPSL